MKNINQFNNHFHNQYLKFNNQPTPTYQSTVPITKLNRSLLDKYSFQDHDLSRTSDLLQLSGLTHNQIVNDQQWLQLVIKQITTIGKQFITFYLQVKYFIEYHKINDDQSNFDNKKSTKPMRQEIVFKQIRQVKSKPVHGSILHNQTKNLILNLKCQHFQTPSTTKPVLTRLQLTIMRIFQQRSQAKPFAKELIQLPTVNDQYEIQFQQLQPQKGTKPKPAAAMIFEINNCIEQDLGGNGVDKNDEQQNLYNESAQISENLQKQQQKQGFQHYTLGVPYKQGLGSKNKKQDDKKNIFDNRSSQQQNQKQYNETQQQFVLQNKIQDNKQQKGKGNNEQEQQQWNDQYQQQCNDKQNSKQMIKRLNELSQYIDENITKSKNQNEGYLNYLQQTSNMIYNYQSQDTMNNNIKNNNNNNSNLNNIQTNLNNKDTNKNNNNLIDNNNKIENNNNKYQLNNNLIQSNKSNKTNNINQQPISFKKTLSSISNNQIQPKPNYNNKQQLYTQQSYTNNIQDQNDNQGGGDRYNYISRVQNTNILQDSNLKQLAIISPITPNSPITYSKKLPINKKDSFFLFNNNVNNNNPNNVSKKLDRDNKELIKNKQSEFIGLNLQQLDSSNIRYKYEQNDISNIEQTKNMQDLINQIQKIQKQWYQKRVLNRNNQGNNNNKNKNDNNKDRDTEIKLEIIQNLDNFIDIQLKKFKIKFSEQSFYRKLIDNLKKKHQQNNNNNKNNKNQLNNIPNHYIVYLTAHEIDDGNIDNNRIQNNNERIDIKIPSQQIQKLLQIQALQQQTNSSNKNTNNKQPNNNIISSQLTMSRSQQRLIIRQFEKQINSRVMKIKINKYPLLQRSNNNKNEQQNKKKTRIIQITLQDELCNINYNNTNTNKIINNKLQNQINNINQINLIGMYPLPIFDQQQKDIQTSFYQNIYTQPLSISMYDLKTGTQQGKLCFQLKKAQIDKQIQTLQSLENYQQPNQIIIQSQNKQYNQIINNNNQSNQYNQFIINNKNQPNLIINNKHNQLIEDQSSIQFVSKHAIQLNQKTSPKLSNNQLNKKSIHPSISSKNNVIQISQAFYQSKPKQNHSKIYPNQYQPNINPQYINKLNTNTQQIKIHSNSQQNNPRLKPYQSQTKRVLNTQSKASLPYSIQSQQLVVGKQYEPISVSPKKTSSNRLLQAGNYQNSNKLLPSHDNIGLKKLKLSMKQIKQKQQQRYKEQNENELLSSISKIRPRSINCNDNQRQTNKEQINNNNNKDYDSIGKIIKNQSSSVSDLKNDKGINNNKISPINILSIQNPNNQQNKQYPRQLPITNNNHNHHPNNNINQYKSHTLPISSSNISKPPNTPSSIVYNQPSQSSYRLMKKQFLQTANLLQSLKLKTQSLVGKVQTQRKLLIQQSSPQSHQQINHKNYQLLSGQQSKIALSGQQSKIALSGQQSKVAYTLPIQKKAIHLQVNSFVINETVLSKKQKSRNQIQRNQISKTSLQIIPVQVSIQSNSNKQKSINLSPNKSRTQDYSLSPKDPRRNKFTLNEQKYQQQPSKQKRQRIQEQQQPFKSKRQKYQEQQLKSKRQKSQQLQLKSKIKDQQKDNQNSGQVVSGEQRVSRKKQKLRIKLMYKDQSQYQFTEQQGRQRDIERRRKKDIGLYKAMKTKSNRKLYGMDAPSDYSQVQYDKQYQKQVQQLRYKNNNKQKIQQQQLSLSSLSLQSQQLISINIYSLKIKILSLPFTTTKNKNQLPNNKYQNKQYFVLIYTDYSNEQVSNQLSKQNKRNILIPPITQKCIRKYQSKDDQLIVIFDQKSYRSNNHNYISQSTSLLLKGKQSNKIFIQLYLSQPNQKSSHSQLSNNQSSLQHINLITLSPQHKKPSNNPLASLSVTFLELLAQQQSSSSRIRNTQSNQQSIIKYTNFLYNKQKITGKIYINYLIQSNHQNNQHQKYQQNQTSKFYSKSPKQIQNQRKQAIVFDNQRPLKNSIIHDYPYQQRQRSTQQQNFKRFRSQSGMTKKLSPKRKKQTDKNTQLSQYQRNPYIRNHQSNQADPLQILKRRVPKPLRSQQKGNSHSQSYAIRVNRPYHTPLNRGNKLFDSLNSSSSIHFKGQRPKQRFNKNSAFSSNHFQGETAHLESPTRSNHQDMLQLRQIKQQKKLKRLKAYQAASQIHQPYQQGSQTRISQNKRYNGGNIKFGKSSRFNSEQSQKISRKQSKQQFPGPGHYEVKSVFQRHTVKQP